MLGNGQLVAVVHLLQIMIYEEQDELTEEDREAIRSSCKVFRENPGKGLSFEDLVTSCGLMLDQIRRVD